MQQQGFRFLHTVGHKIKDDYQTPRSLYKKLDDEFHFDYDPCPAIIKEGMREKDGLGSWGKRNYVNPPFSEKNKWVMKAIEEQRKGKLTVMLLPVDTSTSLFHDHILPNAEIRWIRGRLRFEPKNTPVKFGTMILVFRPKRPEKQICEKSILDFSSNDADSTS